MKDTSVNIDLVFNVSKNQLEYANASLDAMREKTEKNITTTNSFKEAMSKLGAAFSTFGLAVQGIQTLKDILTQPINQAIELNSQYEDLSNSLSSLISINHKNIDSLGNLLSPQEKWNLSLEKSKEIINDLKESGLKLGYSMQDMSDMFKSFYSTAGASMGLQEAKEVMEAIGVAAQVSGADIGSLRATLDTLGSGIIDSTTDFGRFAKSLGLTTQSMGEAKAQGKLYNLMLEKLSPLQESLKVQSISYSTAIGRLSSAFDDIKRNALAPYFEAIKSSILSTTQFLINNQERIQAWAETLLQSISKILAPLKDLARFIINNLISSIKWLTSSFRDSNKELDVFNVYLKTAKSVAISIGAVLSVVSESIKAIINSLKLLIIKASEAYYKIKLAFSLGRDAQAQKSIEALSKQSLDISNNISDNVKNMGSALVGSYEEIITLWSKQQDKVEKKTSTIEKKSTLVGIKRAPEQKEKTKTTKEKSQEEKLKSFLDFEFRIKEKSINLIKDQKQREIELEKLRYEKAITNLGFETQEKIKSGEIVKTQAQALLALEDKLHQKRMEEIKEYNIYAQQITTNIQSNIATYIQQTMIEDDFSNSFKSMLTNMHSSMYQGFSNAIAGAFASSRVMQATQKTMASSIHKVLSSTNIGLSDKLAQSIGGALAGFGAGKIGGGIAGSLLANEQNKETTAKANTIGSALGAGIGSFFGPMGSVIGGAAGGLLGSLVGSFSSKKKQKADGGIELFGASKKGMQAREYENYKTTKTSWWGLRKQESLHTKYSNVSTAATNQIKNTIRAYEYVLQDIGGGIKEISLSSGKYKNYTAIANQAAKSLISNFLKSSNTDHIYKAWEEYAKSINKEVNEALMQSLNSYIETGNTFKSWLYTHRGKDLLSLKFQASLAKKQASRIMQSLGASNINIDNYLQYREEALKKSLTPESIERVNALGKALMNSADVTKKYEEALKKENKTKLELIDPFLKKTKKIQEEQTQKDMTQEKLSVQILSTLRQILRTNQENLNEIEKGKK